MSTVLPSKMLVPCIVSGGRIRPHMSAVFDYEAQPKEHVTECNLCGWRGFEVVAKEDRYAYVARFVRCLGCGLVVLSPRMTAGAYEAFYSGPYRAIVSAYHRKQYDERTIQSEQREYAEKLCETLAPHLESRVTRQVLDIGGSTGMVVKTVAERFGLVGAVLDPSEPELAEARKIGISTYRGTIEATDLEGPFGLVLMCQTADHLLDVTGALRKIRELTRKGGIFWVDIVDYDVARRRLGAQAHKIDHPFYLTPRYMRKFLERARFKVLSEASRGKSGHYFGFVCEAA